MPYRQVHTLLDGVKGPGHYVGTYIAWGVHNTGWWGEGEVKFYLDGDADWPTICGTGTEDYFGGAWDFQQPKGEYGVFSAPFSGLPQVIKPDGLYRSQQRFGMYRWHIMDPVRFQHDLRVTIQALGHLRRASRATFPCRMTSPRRPFGIRLSRTRRSRRCLTSMAWKSFNRRLNLTSHDKTLAQLMRNQSHKEIV